MVKSAQAYVSFGNGVERLGTFIVSLIMSVHIVACMWVFTATWGESFDGTWMEGMEDSQRGELYLTSFYFTITTLTTVGYGDISGSSSVEKIFCICLMLAGTCIYAAASGATAAALVDLDEENAEFKKQIAILNRVFKEYKLPLDVYARLKDTLYLKADREFEELHRFVEELPHLLKVEVSKYLYEGTFKKLQFMQNKSDSFLAWVCPLFKANVVCENEFIFVEGDGIDNLYILQEGVCGYVLAKSNFKYINVTKGYIFGFVDIISSILENEDVSNEDWISRPDKMQRGFTAMASEHAKLWSLSIQDIKRMRSEFLEIYREFF